MSLNDIGIVRGSPNVLMECITCLLPVIVNGALPGQEEGNIDFIRSRNLGIIWDKDKTLNDLVNYLLSNDKEKLIEIKKNELAYRDLDSAKKIVNELENI